MFVSNSLFGTNVGVFPKPPEPFIGYKPTIYWKSIGYDIVLPVKVILIGPMLISGEFLREDPPPPFIGITFALYWSVLALVIYPFLNKILKL
jgi:hypothetical protein